MVDRGWASCLPFAALHCRLPPDESCAVAEILGEHGQSRTAAILNQMEQNRYWGMPQILLK
jgi:hypothetical protein